jgi:hypothetical protein
MAAYNLVPSAPAGTAATPDLEAAPGAPASGPDVGDDGSSMRSSLGNLKASISSSVSSSPDFFLALDDEVHLYIFSFLSGLEVARLAVVSRVWANLIALAFQEACRMENLVADDETATDWKRVYRCNKKVALCTASIWAILLGFDRSLLSAHLSLYRFGAWS